MTLVQWLKRSPETREIVSSSLNQDLLFSCNFIACIDALFSYREVNDFFVR